MFSDSALPALNGVSISVDALVTELRAQGHSVHLFAPGFPGHKELDPNTVRSPYIVTPWAKSYPMAIPPFYRMLYEFRKHEYDIVHTHTPFTIGFVGLRWAQCHDLPIVSTYHTLYDRYAHYVPYFPKGYIRYKIAKHTHYFYNHVQQVICPSETAARWLMRHSVTTPITVIPTGVDKRKILNRSECRAALGMRPEEQTLLFVGRLAKEKNLDTLFQAAKQIFSRQRNVRLFVVGDGPYREQSRRIVRDLNIGDQVVFTGFVSKEEVVQYYAAADVFVFPSVTETQGLVIQEAMLYGLPAVCTVGGGAGEAIIHGENGFLVKNEAAVIADHVLELLTADTLHAKLSNGAMQSVHGKTIDSMCENVVNVYRRALGEHIPDPFVDPIRVL